MTCTVQKDLCVYFVQQCCCLLLPVYMFFSPCRVLDVRSPVQDAPSLPYNFKDSLKPKGGGGVTCVVNYEVRQTKKLLSDSLFFLVHANS